MIGFCMTMIDDDDDKKTFESIYIMYRDRAMATALKITDNRALAEEACSETFLSIASAYPRLKDLEVHQLDYYILVSVKNNTYNLMKKEKKHSVNSNLSDHEEDVSGDVTGDTEYKLIIEKIMQLESTDRQILHMRLVNDMDYASIASILKISASAARKRFSRAREKLAEMLKEEGFYE